MTESTENNTVLTYKDLQYKIDEAIGRYGLNGTIDLLEVMMDEAKEQTGLDGRIELLTEFLVVNCVLVYSLDKYSFFTSQIREYRDARMICFSLLKKYSGCSASFIAQNLGVTKRTVNYNDSNCRDRLTVPASYREFVNNYEIIERRTISFLTQISKTNE